MKCDKCGIRNDADANFCKICGVELAPQLPDVTFNVFISWPPGSQTYNSRYGCLFASAQEVVDSENRIGEPMTEGKRWVGSYNPAQERGDGGRLEIFTWQELTWNGQEYILGPDEGPRTVGFTNLEKG